MNDRAINEALERMDECYKGINDAICDFNDPRSVLREAREQLNTAELILKKFRDDHFTEG
jgi:hypothetical protein